MKLCGLKHHLRGLICIFILSLFLVSCAGRTSAPLQAEQTLVPEYYILKKPDAGDFARLRKFRQSADPAVSASAGLILAWYYMRDGNVHRANNLISQYKDEKSLSDFMKYMVALWRMEVDLRLGYIKEAKEIAALLGEDAHAKEADRAFKTYCISMHLRPLFGYGNFSCIDQRIKNHEKTFSGRSRERPAKRDLTDNDFPAEEEKTNVGVVETPPVRPSLSGALNILVISAADTQDAGGGISYYMRQKGIRHRVTIAKEFRDGNWDYIIDLDSEELIGATFSIDFRPNVFAQTNYLGGSDRLISCGRVLIGVGVGFNKVVEDLQTRLTDLGKLVATSRLTDISQSSVMRGRLKAWENDRFCVIGVGNENEMNVFIPTVRSYIINARRQTVYIIQPVDTGRNYTRGYERYYRNSYIYPGVELTLSENMRAFAKEYENFSGRTPAYQTVLGYDMMHYIHINTEEGANDSSEYLTNIEFIEDERVMRSVIGFQVDNRGNVEQLVFDMRSVDEPEELAGVGVEFEHE